jgi:hypothetical protein
MPSNALLEGHVAQAMIFAAMLGYRLKPWRNVGALCWVAMSSLYPTSNRSKRGEHL